MVARRAARLAAVAAICFSLVAAGHAQPTSPQGPSRTNGNPQEMGVFPTDIPIEVNADRLSYSKETNTYTVRGNVTLRQGNTKLRADTVSYNADSGELAASGGVIVRMGGDVVEAEKFTLRLRDSTGVLYNGKLLLTRNNIYLEGEKLEKVGDSTYRIQKGSFTTCDGATPDWRITGRDLDVTLEGYGTLTHGVFYVKDIPVLYIPWLIYPAKRQRQTGFLMPTFASSSFRGFDVRFPFFININPSMDATLVPRICSKRALQASLEFRYMPYENLQGRFYGEYTYDWKYGPESDPESHRFYVTLRHDQEIADWLRLKVNGNWVSDRDYFEFWGGRFDRRLRVRYLESNAVLYRQTNNFLFQAEARHFDNLDLPDNALTVQNLPIITGTLFNSRIPFTPFYVSSNVVYDHFYSPILHERWLGSRVQADTRLSFPIALGRYLKMEPSMTYFAKAYMADYYVRDKSLSSVTTVRTDLYQIDADLFTDLNTVYGGSFLGFQRIKHTFRPRFAWTYRPFAKPQMYPQFDEQDRLDRMSLLTAEMRQTLTGRLGSGEYLDFMTFIVSQGYDFSKPTSTDDPIGLQEFDPSRLTATQAELTIRPHTLLDLTAQAEYDPVVNRARRYSVQLGLMDHRGDTMRVLHQFIEDEKKTDLNRQTNVNLQMKLTSDLDCFVETQYTHQFDFSYFTSIGLNYHPRCWSILLRYSEVREQDPVTGRIKDPDQTIFATLSLYGLGQIYQFTRDWGELMGDVGESRPSGSR
ncbi:MAG: LPS assembly protein LptD [Desulfomonilaceae bacterium]|nr:LPS assembly protein LptD [Desulfomonilaceae bacterium]